MSSKNLYNAKLQDKFLKVLLEESDKGNLRISDIADRMSISVRETRGIYFYLTHNWHKEYIEWNKDGEIWLNSAYIPAVEYFLDNGGFERIQKRENAEYRNTVYGFWVSILALVVSIIAVAISFYR